MTNHKSHIEILVGPERRRHWMSAKNLSMAQEIYETGATVRLVARRMVLRPNGYT